MQCPKEILTALLILPTAHEVVVHEGIVTEFLACKKTYILNGN